MKKKKIRIPIYECNLTLILDKDLSYIEKRYKTISLSNYDAVTMRVPNKNSEYIIAFSTNKASVIAHEIIHLKNYIYKDFCIELDKDNDEHEAYLVGYLFEQINKFIKDDKSKHKQRKDRR